MLFALLVLCLAAPAIAVPVHCAPAQPQASAHHPSHHGEEQPAQSSSFGQKGHDCIGCGVPQFGAPSLPELMPYPPAAPFVREGALVLANAARPETPPPRT